MSIDTTWLRCPNCLLDLSAIDDRVFGCPNGHRFDRARQGYLTLLPPRAPRTIGDDREMLAARAALLDHGAYSPIAEAVAAAAPRSRRWRPVRRRGSPTWGAEPATTRQRSLAHSPTATFLLADRSPDAVRISLRALPDATGVVLDLWRPLPIRDDTVDVALNVFAPRNGGEFARVLRPDGRLVVVVPAEAHLQELRRTGALLDIPAGKADRVAEQLAESGFHAETTTTIEYSLETDAATRGLLAGMGPSAHHAGSLSSEAGDAPVDVTIAVDVLVFAQLAPSSP